MDDGMSVELVDCCDDALLEFLFRCDSDVAQDGAGKFGKEALDEIEPGAVLGREGEFEAAGRLIGEPSFGFLGNVRGMIVEDQLDRRVGWIGGVEKLEEFDEFAAAVAILDQSVNRAVALIFMIAREGRVRAGLGRQIRGGRGYRLDAGLLVIGDDRHRVARLLLRCGRGLFNDLDLAVDAQNFRHLGFELGVAAFQVVAHLVRLDLLLIEYLAQSALNQLAKAGVPFGWALLARVTSQKPRRPQFVRIAQVLRLAAGQRDQPCPGLGSDRRLLARPGTIVERRHWTVGQRPLNAAAGPSDDAPPKLDPPQRTRGLSGKPTAFALARPGSPAPFASVLSKRASPNPLLRSTTQSLVAVPS